MTEFSKLGEFTSDRQSGLSDIYNKRLQIVNESITNMQKEAMPLSNPRLDSKWFSYVRLVSVPQKESTF